MDTAKLLGLLLQGPGSEVVLAVGGDPSWHVDEDWGLGEWRVIRVPTGLRFERRSGTTVRESVVLRCDRTGRGTRATGLPAGRDLLTSQVVAARQPLSRTPVGPQGPRGAGDD